jgi:hypothetical protein
MPYATAGAVSCADYSNDPAWVMITDTQYQEALDGMLSGLVVVIDGGFAVVPPPNPDSPVTPQPAELTLDDYKAAQQEKLNTDFSAAATALTAGYPEAERLTWPIQQSEIMAWGADNTAPTPYLDGIAAARGIDPAEMRAITLTQVQLFQAASQQLVGKRQKLRDMIQAASTIEDVFLVTW